MSMASEELADRIRAYLSPALPIREQRMFGGIAFMHSGNMLVAVMKDGGLLARVGKDDMDAALDLPGASPMNMGGRNMTGFVAVSGDAIEDDEALNDWIARCSRFVATLPPK